MSDSILKLIPISPFFIPDSRSQKNLNEFLKSIFKSNEFRITVTDDIEFIDCGENFEEVMCPYCKQSLDMDWWGETMCAISKSHFKKSFKLPCCNKKSQIFDLLYKENCGFSKFMIEVLIPNIQLNPVQLYELEKILGCELKVIKAYY